MLQTVIRRALVTLIVCLAPALASAQVPTDADWSAEAAVGWDFAAGGNILSAGIGRVFDQATVIQDQSYGDVYGTGVRFGFGVGYMLDDYSEVRGEISLQSSSSKLVQIGSSGTSPLYATFDDYKTISFDAGYRRYFAERRDRMRPYAGGTIGVAIISEIDADLAVPELDQTLAATDFYDRTGAFAFGVNGGVLYALTDGIDVKGELGIRHVGGLSPIDGLAGTGLEGVNDDSGRWTVPLTVGVRIRF